MNSVSDAVSCIIDMISIMCKSICAGLDSSKTFKTQSVTIGVKTSATSGVTLVLKLDLATCNNNSLSSMLSFLSIMKLFKNSNEASLPFSKPSAKTLGCMPSLRKICACLKSSPTNKHTVVVPSPVISSCAVAALAIMMAVGDWICISVSKTLPSLVILIPPAPSTNIFKVPLGPKLELKTSCSPIAALMLT